MNRWPHSVEPIGAQEITRYCVNDPEWQKFRLSLKGLPTTEKLDKLDAWYGLPSQASRRTRVQVDNYINALRRGGQLDLGNNVQR